MIVDSRGQNVLPQITKKIMLADDGRSRVSDVDFSGVDLHNGRIEDLIFDCCTFDSIVGIGVTAKNIDFDGGSFADSDFSQGRFEKVSFYAIDAIDSLFNNVDFKDTEFLGCNLSYSCFKGARFHNVLFGADKLGVKTSLEGVDFSSSNLRSSMLTAATHDNTTVFPRGFADR